MTTATFATDAKFWLTVTVNVLNAYLVDDYDKRTMENVAIALMARCHPDGSLPYEALTAAAAAIDPGLVDDDEAFGEFAWLLDSAVDHFSAKACLTH